MDVNKKELERLSSWLTHFNAVFAILLIALLAFAFINTSSDKQARAELMSVGLKGILFVLAFSIYALWYTIKARMIYYKDSCIYSYRLFSSSVLRLEKEKIKKIELKSTRSMLYSGRSLFTWTLIYEDDLGVERTVYFMKNFFNYDFDATIAPFNRSQL